MYFVTYLEVRYCYAVGLNNCLPAICVSLFLIYAVGYRIELLFASDLRFKICVASYSCLERVVKVLGEQVGGVTTGVRM